MFRKLVADCRLSQTELLYRVISDHETMHLKSPLITLLAKRYRILSEGITAQLEH